MHILFSPNLEDHATLQVHALGLGAKLTSEEAVVQEVARLETALRSTESVRIYGSYSLFLLPVIAAVGYFDYRHLFGLIPVLLILGWFATSLAKSVADTHRQLCLHLDTRPDLCAELKLLSEQSKAVRTYLHNVNESGRHLRVFDIAGVNHARHLELKAELRHDVAANISHLQSL